MESFVYFGRSRFICIFLFENIEFRYLLAKKWGSNEWEIAVQSDALEEILYWDGNHFKVILNSKIDKVNDHFKYDCTL